MTFENYVLRRQHVGRDLRNRIALAFLYRLQVILKRSLHHLSDG